MGRKRIIDTESLTGLVYWKGIMYHEKNTQFLYKVPGRQGKKNDIPRLFCYKESILVFLAAV
jgi:hypothetical protein